jgi:uncharacterized repeat protein (TIGR02543 family)
MVRGRALVCVCLGLLVVVPSASGGSTGAAAPVARIGMNYFDGWSDLLSNHHFDGLARAGVNGAFRGRQPLSGWRDNTLAAMRASLNWAHQDGVDFFFFDWYYRPASAEGGATLNTALGNYMKLPAHDAVGAALMYVNVDPFVVPASDWQSTVERWVTEDFANPDYARVDGKPLLVIMDSFRFTEQWGGSAGVNAALDVLRRTAIAHGLPGVFVVGSVFVGTCVDSVDWDYFASMIRGESWDALTQYAYPAAACVRDGPQPYSDLVAAGESSWNWYATSFDSPNIPTVMVGWDPRPWDERPAGRLWWFESTPAEFGGFVGDAINWANEHPEQMVEPPPARPIVLVTSWNEIGEGEAVIPNRESGYGYGQALAQAVGLPRPEPTRQTLSITAGRGGIVNAVPAAANCRSRCRTAIDDGWHVILTAIPRHGYTFRGWSGGCRGPGRSCSFIIEHDTSVRATFKRSK